MWLINYDWVCGLVLSIWLKGCIDVWVTTFNIMTISPLLKCVSVRCRGRGVGGKQIKSIQPLLCWQLQWLSRHLSGLVSLIDNRGESWPLSMGCYHYHLPWCWDLEIQFWQSFNTDVILNHKMLCPCVSVLCVCCVLTCILIIWVQWLLQTFKHLKGSSQAARAVTLN